MSSLAHILVALLAFVAIASGQTTRTPTPKPTTPPPTRSSSLLSSSAAYSASYIQSSALASSSSFSSFSSSAGTTTSTTTTTRSTTSVTGNPTVLTTASRAAVVTTNGPTIGGPTTATTRGTTTSATTRGTTTSATTRSATTSATTAPQTVTSSSGQPGAASWYLRVTFNNCPNLQSFFQALDETTLYQVSYTPDANCAKAVLLIGSARSGADAQKRALEAAQDSANQATGVTKTEIISANGNSGSGSGSGSGSSGRYPTWSAIFMIILIFVFLLTICGLVYLIATKGRRQSERSGDYTKLNE